MPHLRRHQLAYLSAAGWREALAAQLPDDATAPLQAWAARGLPLVVPRQPGNIAPGRVALAWTTPRAAGRLRVAVEVSVRSVAWFDEFPDAGRVLPLLPRRVRAATQSLLASLCAEGARPRVYGSYGWQVLSGEEYVREGSDLDIWIGVDSYCQGDAVTRVLARPGTPANLRIDGELLFPDGAGVAWREYAAWRAGRVRTVLVKRIDAVEVAPGLALPAWCEAMAA